eukprot:15437785-Alexandrium_andersonii.AAC.1
MREAQEAAGSSAGAHLLLPMWAWPSNAPISARYPGAQACPRERRGCARLDARLPRRRLRAPPPDGA